MWVLAQWWVRSGSAPQQAEWIQSGRRTPGVILCGSRAGVPMQGRGCTNSAGALGWEQAAPASRPQPRQPQAGSAELQHHWHNLWAQFQETSPCSKQFRRPEEEDAARSSVASAKGRCKKQWLDFQRLFPPEELPKKPLKCLRCTLQLVGSTASPWEGWAGGALVSWAGREGATAATQAFERCSEDPSSDTLCESWGWGRSCGGIEGHCWHLLWGYLGRWD